MLREGVLGNPVEQNNVIPTILGFAADCSPRVRAGALRGLLTLHHRGFHLPVACQATAAMALRDESEVVRAQAMLLLWCAAVCVPVRAHPWHAGFFVAYIRSSRSPTGRR